DSPRLDAVNHYDVARYGLVDLDTIHALEFEDLVHPPTERTGIPKKNRNILQRLDAPAMDASDADLADVAGVVERADLQLQRAFGALVAHRYIFENGLEERSHVLSNILRVIGGPALPRPVRDYRR